MTYLAVPISAADIDQAAGQIQKAVKAGAEMLELRTDFLENLNLELFEELFSRTRLLAPDLPIIVTCRDIRQGGSIDYPIQLRIDILLKALALEAEFVDFEFENFQISQYRSKMMLGITRSVNSKLILSHHDFKSKFENIHHLYRRILTVYPAAIPKLVYTANHINDCFDSFDLLHRTSGQRIVFCMGKAGLITRILAKKLGSLVTFASLDDQSATAPGQIAIEQFKNLYRFDSIGTETELYGLVGWPVAHSMSPAVHNGLFAESKQNKVYLPFLVEGGKEDFNKFVNNMVNRTWLNLCGLSVTLPHKLHALEYAAESNGEIESLAERIQAVNTLIFDSRCQALNTDHAGALDAITDTIKQDRSWFKSKKTAIIGAGGVARALVAGLSDLSSEITIYNRTVEKAERLANEFSCSFAGLDEIADIQADLLINCTSIGMHPNVDASPVPESVITKDMVVFDTIYNPQVTKLLQQARSVGAKTVSGKDMFINQAIGQSRLFTGNQPKADLVRKIVDTHLPE